MLCAQCSAAFGEVRVLHVPLLKPRKVPERELQLLHGDWNSLRNALDAGCRFCHQLVHTTQHQVNRRKSKIFSGVGLLPDLESESFTMKVRLAFETESRRVLSCLCVCNVNVRGKALQERFTEYMFLSADQSPHVASPTISETRDDSASVDIIESWIDRCINNHTRCSKRHMRLSRNRFARILDVGSLDASEVTLRASAGLPDNLQYITLSHCWGGAVSQIPCLTTANYDQYCSGIPVASLPETFRDAVHLTRRLKVRYLWIDSLCILQDSKDDWLEQSAIMGEVYLGSYLNVAATSSQNPSGGLFCARNPFLMKPLRIEMSGTAAQNERSSLRHSERRWCTLEHMSILTIATPRFPVTYDETRSELNEFLGNHDGHFSTAGKNFSLSAKNVQLHGNSLHAELKTLRGQWNHSTADLSKLPGLTREQQVYMLSFRLEGSSTLVIRSPSALTTWHKKQIDLNQHLGNANGRFTRRGTNFGHTATDVKLSQLVLSADLKTVAGEWCRDSMDIGPLLDELESTQVVAQVSDRSPRSTFYDVGADYYANWAADVARGNLCSRGWVFQERLLAPRVVHFTQHQMYFECIESRSLEQTPELEVDCRQPAARDTRMDFKAWDVFSPDLILEPEPRRLGVNYVWSSLKAMFGRANLDLSKDDLSKSKHTYAKALRMCYGHEIWMPTHSLIKYWSAILSAYLANNLTYEEDRLLAIAGLAKVLSERTGVRYVAGLWRYQLPRQLLWNSYKHGRNQERRAQYIAPSWSPASCSAFLGGRGVGLHPILESKGAMDLVKVLKVDVRGVLLQDDPPFGRIREGRLRLRGRLLPISLNLDAWPDGESRRDHLVQYWTGQSAQRPTGATFLVPVLFTRWNSRLPASTANSLLLECTEETGVFRRIGVARLSSRCPLNEIAPQLHAAQSSLYEDEDDDADTDGEANEEDLDPYLLMLSSKKIPPNPQQELADKRREVVTNPDLSKQVDTLQQRWLKKHARSDCQDQGDQSCGSVGDKLGVLQSALKFVQAEAPGKPAWKVHTSEKQKKEMQDAMKIALGCEVTHVTRNHIWTQYPPNPVTMLQPREAIGQHFYLRYEEDEDTSRYGHFVFDII